MALLSEKHPQMTRTGRVRRWIAVVAILLSGAGATFRAAESSIAYENQVKAVFLFHFAQFVTWPADAFARPNDPIVITVLGDDPFGSYLDEVVGNEKIGRRALIVRRCRRIEEVGPCQMLFVCASESPHTRQILATLANRPVLTVGDADHFTVDGGMVRFVYDGRKIRLRINPGAAQAAKLSISSKLLRFATLVSTGKE